MILFVDASVPESAPEHLRIGCIEIKLRDGRDFLFPGTLRSAKPENGQVRGHIRIKGPLPLKTEELYGMTITRAEWQTTTGEMLADQKEYQITQLEFFDQTTDFFYLPVSTSQPRYISTFTGEYKGAFCTASADGYASAQDAMRRITDVVKALWYVSEGEFQIVEMSPDGSVRNIYHRGITK